MEKYIRVMADYCSAGLWGYDGIMVEAIDLDLPNTIAKRLDAWQRWHDRDNQDYLEESVRSKEFDTMTFSLEGLRIAQAIKAYLGDDWTVIYFDEEKSLAPNVDRSVYEYEV